MSNLASAQKGPPDIYIFVVARNRVQNHAVVPVIVNLMGRGGVRLLFARPIYSNPPQWHVRTSKRNKMSSSLNHNLYRLLKMFESGVCRSRNRKKKRRENGNKSRRVCGSNNTLLLLSEEVNKTKQKRMGVQLQQVLASAARRCTQYSCC